MKPSIFLNDMLTKGAILGIVMLLVDTAEVAMLTYGHSLSWLIVMVFESLLATALYIFLAYRFTRNYANMVLEARKEMPFFSYGSGLSYVVSLYLLAGIIVSLGGWMVRHYIVGYDNFINSSVSLIYEIMAMSQIPAPLASAYNEMLNALKSQDEPTLISTIFSGMWSYLVKGSCMGLIIAAFTVRKPQIFDKQDEQ